eukprot:725437-Prymnesium_polylepis.2
MLWLHSTPKNSTRRAGDSLLPFASPLGSPLLPPPPLAVAPFSLTLALSLYARAAAVAAFERNLPTDSHKPRNLPGRRRQKLSPAPWTTRTRVEHGPCSTANSSSVGAGSTSPAQPRLIEH